MTLVIGMLLDALLGEPRWLWSRVPHPAVLMGRLIGGLDARFNAGDHRKAKGIVVLAALVISAGLLGQILQALPGHAIDVVVVAVILAQKSLADHVSAVAQALRISLGDGKRAVAMIVGRDTRDMDAPAVARAAIESAAENLSDGVIAPALWFLTFGLPGLLIYKITNTADSMIGYRSPRHAEFGWAAARFDDLLNLVPARLTAAMIWAVTSRPAVGSILRDAPLHRSPNAGWPEAAVAHGLGIALSGPRSYDGQIRDYPFVNAAGRRDLTPADIDRSVAVLWKSWGLMLAIAAITAF